MSQQPMIRGIIHASRRIEENVSDITSSNGAYLMFLTFIICCFAVCYFQGIVECLRSSDLSLPQHVVEESPLDARVYDLNSSQRRAVLESFFKIETVNSEDNLKKDVKFNENESPSPDSPIASEGEAIIIESPAVSSICVTCVGDNSTTKGPQLMPNNGDDTSQVDVADTENNKHQAEEEEDNSVDHENIEMSTMPKRLTPVVQKESTDGKHERKCSENKNTAHAGPLEDDEEPVCAICLCEYEDGEKIINSKHCSHKFHKICIFEWLDKHDVCPICREGMITDGELNSAATTVVRKQRMVRAVASYR